MPGTDRAPVTEGDCIGAVSAATSSYMTLVGMQWEPTDTEGFWVKRLYEDEDRHECTWLMRIDPGAYSSPHAHEQFEQVYVLEGSFYDDDRLVKAGEFCARSPGAVHSAASEEGALMLVMYTKA